MYNICMEIIIGWRIFVQIFLKYKYGFIVFDWLFVLGNLYSIKMAQFAMRSTGAAKFTQIMLDPWLYVFCMEICIGNCILVQKLYKHFFNILLKHGIPFWLGIWTCRHCKSSSELPVVPLRVVPFSIANCTISMKYKNSQNQQIRVQIQLVH